MAPITTISGRDNMETSTVDYLPSAPRSVWILVRPLSLAITFPTMGLISDGKPYLCHWGVLVTMPSIDDLRALICPQGSATDELVLGAMWELHREQEHCNVNRTRPFRRGDVIKHWGINRSYQMGTTFHTDQQIQLAGKLRFYFSTEFSCSNH